MDSVSEKESVRILSIDGGGIKGIIPAGLLAEIERRTGKATSSLFDLVAGTSTGGILALALVKPSLETDSLVHSAASMVGFYQRLGPAIFSKPLSHVIESVDGLLESRYPDAPIENALQDFFGEMPLSQALTPVFVPSYDLNGRAPFFFRSERAKQNSSFDFPMHVVARSTSAAPTYFPPKSVSCAGTNQNYVLIDGGVFANNPSACALVEARVQFPKATEFTLVSLGTGTPKEQPLMRSPENWGLAQWVRPILDTVFDGVSRTVDYQMSQLLASRPDGTRGYFRLDPTLTSASQKMDNASPEALDALRAITSQTIVQQSREIDLLCSQLVA